GGARLPRPYPHAQSRVPGGIAATHLGGHRDLANQLGEERTTLGVGRRLVVLDLLPFTVASHASLVVGSSPSSADAGSENICWRDCGREFARVSAPRASRARTGSR